MIPHPMDSAEHVVERLNRKIKSFEGMISSIRQTLQELETRQPTNKVAIISCLQHKATLEYVVTELKDIL